MEQAPKNSNTLIVVLVVAIVLLTGSTTYFFAQSLNRPIKEIAVTLDATKTFVGASPSPSVTASDTTTPTTTPVYLASDAVSGPSNVYTVALGETLFTIANKNELSWEALVKVNNLVDPNKITAGQQLVIPSADANKKLYVDFVLNDARAQNAQTLADAGKNPERIDALKVAQKDAANLFGIASSDVASIDNSGNTEGTTAVLVTHEGKSYHIDLTQPLIKGAKGIWAVVKVSEG